jgi:hypothetical protein
MKKLLLGLACLIPLSANADDHMPPAPGVAQIFECTLNSGVGVGDVVAFGSTAVNQFVDQQKLQISSYLWEAVAVNEPYREPDVRWVNYYPSWQAMYAGGAAFASNGTDLVGQFNSMLDCDKPVLLASQNLMSDLVMAQQKPMIAAVCQLNEGKTPMDAMQVTKQMADLANTTLGTDIGASMFLPAFGITGFDYVGTFYGNTGDMAKLMDSVRDRTLPARMAAAGLQPAAECVNDLHTSHLMIPQ